MSLWVVSSREGYVALSKSISFFVRESRKAMPSGRSSGSSTEETDVTDGAEFWPRYLMPAESNTGDGGLDSESLEVAVVHSNKGLSGGDSGDARGRKWPPWIGGTKFFQWPSMRPMRYRFIICRASAEWRLQMGEPMAPVSFGLEASTPGRWSVGWNGTGREVLLTR